MSKKISATSFEDFLKDGSDETPNANCNGIAAHFWMFNYCIRAA